jgi:hypothetical protein
MFSSDGVVSVLILAAYPRAEAAPITGRKTYPAIWTT